MRVWKLLPWVLAFLVLGLAVVHSNGVQPVEAKQLFFGSGGCMADICGGVPKDYQCTANDVTITIVETWAVNDYCEYVGDTGTYMFRAKIQGGAKKRYDIGWWIASDGVDAYNGTCFSDYLRPPLLSAGLPVTGDVLGPPFWDLEYANNGGTDACGDVNQDQTNYEVFGPVTLQCSAELMDGSIDTCIAWDNQVADNCPENYACPLPRSKCNCETVPFEVNLNLVDLALIKMASAAYIPPDGLFEYYLTVANVGWQGTCYTSTGYTVRDDLPIWLKARTPLPAGCVSEADPDEVCYSYPGGCQGYGDIVTCTVTTDLPGPCTATAPEITLPVQLWLGTPAVPVEDPRNNPPANLIAVNVACVQGFEVDPNESNNCDHFDIPTAVNLSSFTAVVEDRAITLSWETASETDNLGFNLYRSRSADGRRIKLNTELIPSLVPPGSPFGAVYSFTDTAAKLGRTYYYWLEDVDYNGFTTLHGPVTAQLVFKNKFTTWVERFRPRFYFGR